MLLAMPTVKATGKEGLVRSDLDTYEIPGVLYFHFNGRQMVAIVREQAEFDRRIGDGDSLDGYANKCMPSRVAIEAATTLFELIPAGG